jgi:hypothetical protein
MRSQQGRKTPFTPFGRARRPSRRRTPRDGKMARSLSNCQSTVDFVGVDGSRPPAAIVPRSPHPVNFDRRGPPASGDVAFGAKPRQTDPGSTTAWHEAARAEAARSASSVRGNPERRGRSDSAASRRRRCRPSARRSRCQPTRARSASRSARLWLRSSAGAPSASRARAERSCQRLRRAFDLGLAEPRLHAPSSRPAEPEREIQPRTLSVQCVARGGAAAGG